MAQKQLLGASSSKSIDLACVEWSSSSVAVWPLLNAAPRSKISGDVLLSKDKAASTTSATPCAALIYIET